MSSHEKHHDRLSRKTFSRAAVAWSELEPVVPPEVMARLDPGSLQEELGDFVDEELQERSSDRLFSWPSTS